MRTLGDFVDSQKWVDCWVVHVAPDGVGSAEFNGQFSLTFTTLADAARFAEALHFATQPVRYEVVYSPRGLGQPK